jgi:hypothetical protein
MKTVKERLIRKRMSGFYSFPVQGIIRVLREYIPRAWTSRMGLGLPIKF